MTCPPFVKISAWGIESFHSDVVSANPIMKNSRVYHGILVYVKIITEVYLDILSPVLWLFTNWDAENFWFNSSGSI